MKVSPPFVVVLALCTASIANSAELQTNTLAAWDQYIGVVDARLKASPAADGAFLWVDQAPGQAQRVRRGEVVVSQIKAPAAQRIPHGLIHDWIGAVFIPDATLPEVLAAARNYDQFPTWYGPTIVHANLLSQSDNEDRVTIRYVRTVLFVTVVVEAEYETRYYPVDATRLYSVARSAHIDEIQDYGKSNQRKTPSDDGSGFIWRTYTVTRYEQRDGGVYMEQENIVLSRSIPASFRWLVEPAVRRLAKDLLDQSLRQTREMLRPKR